MEKEETEAFNIGIAIGPLLNENMIKAIASKSVKSNRTWSKAEYIRHAIALANAAEGFGEHTND